MMVRFGFYLLVVMVSGVMQSELITQGMLPSGIAVKFNMDWVGYGHI